VYAQPGSGITGNTMMPGSGVTGNTMMPGSGITGNTMMPGSGITGNTMMPGSGITGNTVTPGALAAASTGLAGYYAGQAAYGAGQSGATAAYGTGQSGAAHGWSSSSSSDTEEAHDDYNHCDSPGASGHGTAAHKRGKLSQMKDNIRGMLGMKKKEPKDHEMHAATASPHDDVALHGDAQQPVTSYPLSAGTYTGNTMTYAANKENYAA
jgi:hypothetical protein